MLLPHFQISQRKLPLNPTAIIARFIYAAEIIDCLLTEMLVRETCLQAVGACGVQHTTKSSNFDKLLD